MKEPPSPLFIVKLGGSVITDKAVGNKKLDQKTIQRVATEIKQALKKKPFQLVLVCGVGSFGHTLVAKYDLDQKIKTKKQKEGIRKTHASTQKLGKSVTRILFKAGLPAKYLSCAAHVSQKNKKIKSFNETPFSDLLQKGFIPVTTGTMALDTKLGYSVLSGDEIIGQLAVRLDAKKVLLGTDVDGIYTQDPRLYPKAKLIQSVTNSNLKTVIAGAGQSQSVDVTKGMKGKIEKIAAHLHGKPAAIFNLTKPHYLKQLLEEKTVRSTLIQLTK